MNQLKENKTLEEIKADFEYTFNVDVKEGKFYDDFSPKDMWEWVLFHFVPNAQVQSEKQQYLRRFVEFLEDHYWDTLEKDRDLLGKHIASCLEDFISQENKDDTK